LNLKLTEKGYMSKMITVSS